MRVDGSGLEPTVELRDHESHSAILSHHTFPLRRIISLHASNWAYGFHQCLPLCSRRHLHSANKAVAGAEAETAGLHRHLASNDLVSGSRAS